MPKNPVYVSTFDECVDECAEEFRCIDVSYIYGEPKGPSYLKTTFGPSRHGRKAVWGAKQIEAAPGDAAPAEQASTKETPAEEMTTQPTVTEKSNPASTERSDAVNCEDSKDSEDSNDSNDSGSASGEDLVWPLHMKEKSTEPLIFGDEEANMDEPSKLGSAERSAHTSTTTHIIVTTWVRLKMLLLQQNGLLGLLQLRPLFLRQPVPSPKCFTM